MVASDLRHAYAVLELSPPVTEARLKRRYKALVRRWHPDRYQADPVGQAEATQRLCDINIAYDLVVVSLGSSETAPVEPPVNATDPPQTNPSYSPPPNATERPFSWSPERVDAVVDSINRSNDVSLLPEISRWNRPISAVIALLWLGQWALRGGVAGVLMGAVLMLVPFMCIWFPDELADRTLGLGPIAPRSVQGCAVRFAGWLLLLTLIASFIILTAPPR